jgi:hypothetical protein
MRTELFDNTSKKVDNARAPPLSALRDIYTLLLLVSDR